MYKKKIKYNFNNPKSVLFIVPLLFHICPAVPVFFSLEVLVRCLAEMELERELRIFVENHLLLGSVSLLLALRQTKIIVKNGISLVYASNRKQITSTVAYMFTSSTSSSDASSVCIFASFFAFHSDTAFCTAKININNRLFKQYC